MAGNREAIEKEHNHPIRGTVWFGLQMYERRSGKRRNGKGEGRKKVNSEGHKGRKEERAGAHLRSFRFMR